MRTFALFIALLLPLLLAAVASAQEADGKIYDKVELRDGSTLVGEIVSYEAGVVLRLRLRSGEIAAIPAREVKRISQFQTGGAKPYEFREQGFFGSLDGGLIFGNNGPRFQDRNGYQLSVGGGYQFNRFVGLGLESGFRQMVDGTGEKFIPLGLVVRGFPFASKVAPFYSVSAGYGFATDLDDPNYRRKEGGLYLQPAVGLRIGAASGANAFVKMSYVYQKAEYEYPLWFWPQPNQDGPFETQKLIYKRWSISAGVMF